jgi:hypothetical protein
MTGNEVTRGTAVTTSTGQQVQEKETPPPLDKEEANSVSNQKNPRKENEAQPCTVAKSRSVGLSTGGC